MSLQERIQSDLTAAMKARDKRRTSALRMIVAAVRNAAVADGRGPQGDVPDEIVERILTREVKHRREAAEAFRERGREEEASEEEADAEIYGEYLPEPLGDDELIAIVEETIAKVGAEGPQDMGRVMGVVMPKVGNRAGGQRVSALVKSRLIG